MKITNNMKNAIIGIPLIFTILAFIIFLASNYGPGALFMVMLLAILSYAGMLLGSVIRYKFKLWR
ncbi:hypothetical protein [Salmonella phage SSE121]|uniref:Uncharacterized protein n=1 Tax=Salmonella phage SSE121 TaxID=1204529 RepID=K4I1K9_9CAUD|nr:hypothetical protein ACQ19_gp150 [Salmonella phage SSE121]AFU63791.1 hypothetical protein [Salmonella phage SSE121]